MRLPPVNSNESPSTKSPDRGATGAVLFVSRFARALDQPAIGQEVADLLEAFDVLDLVQDRERQDLPDPKVTDERGLDPQRYADVDEKQKMKTAVPLKL